MWGWTVSRIGLDRTGPDGTGAGSALFRSANSLLTTVSRTGTDSAQFVRRVVELEVVAVLHGNALDHDRSA